MASLTVRQEMARGMALARAWREGKHLLYTTSVCGRCEGVGVVWWCGKPGLGGRRGPCPRCQHLGTARFRAQLAGELFDANSREGQLRPTAAWRADAQPPVPLARLRRDGPASGVGV